MGLSEFLNRGFFHQLFAGAAASLGGFSAATLFGWVTPILPELLSPESEIPMTPQQASWMISIPEIANLFTPVPAAILMDRFGRKPLILLSAPFFTLGWAIILCWKTYACLLLARSIQGAAVGVGLTAIPVYLGEIASIKYRGAITSLFFLFFWMGYLFEYCTGPFMSLSNFTILTLVPSVVYFVLILFQPESPYFCVMKGDKAAAYKSLKWFRSYSEEAITRELETMIASIDEDQRKKRTFKEVIATSTDRKALYLMLFAGSLRILCGVNSIMIYATQNFQEIPGFFIDPKYVTIILGVVLVLGACFSFFTIDLLGRRSLLILSSLGAGVSLLIAGTFYYLDSNTTVDVSPYSWVAPVSTLVYAGVVVAGLCPVHTAYTSELFNSNTRANASSIAAIVSTFFTFISLKFFQTFIDLYGVYFNYFLFSAICFGGAVVSYCVMPETKNKTFEQIRLEFNSIHSIHKLFIHHTV